MDETAIRGAVLLVLCAVLGILVFFFMLSKKNASKAKGGADLSEYDFGDEEEEEEDYASQFEKYDPESEEDE